MSVLTRRLGAARTATGLKPQQSSTTGYRNISRLQLVRGRFDLIHMVMHFSVSGTRILHVGLNYTAQELGDKHCNNALTTGTPCVVCELRSLLQRDFGVNTNKTMAI